MEALVESVGKPAFIRYINAMMSDVANRSRAFREDPGPPSKKTDPASLFTVDVEGFEGPIDLLLAMARRQKVDLVRISILALADQYLSFVAEARRSNLELAADYLVMAAWLAYLKSRMLLPDIESEEEPTGEEMASALQFQLRRLEAMREVGAKLMARVRLGEDFFPRGRPETFAVVVNAATDLSLRDLLKAYGAVRSKRSGPRTMRIERFDLHTVDDAIARLRRFLNAPVPDWQTLRRFLPENLQGGLATRSAVAATFAASLELAKQGEVSIRQDEVFGPIYFRAKETAGTNSLGPARASGARTEPDDDQ